MTGQDRRPDPWPGPPSRADAVPAADGSGADRSGAHSSGADRSAADRSGAEHSADDRPAAPDPSRRPGWSERWAVHSRRGPRPWTLAVLLALVALNAVYGGVGLIRNGLGMSASWAERLPGHSWTLAGIALLAMVAVPQLAALVLILCGDPRAAWVAVLVGTGLVAWIVVQVLVLRRYVVLQPVVAGLGLVELFLAVGWIRALAPHGEHRSRT